MIPIFVSLSNTQEDMPDPEQKQAVDRVDNPLDRKHQKTVDLENMPDVQVEGEVKGDDGETAQPAKDERKPEEKKKTTINEEPNLEGATNAED